jgi:hypothetical protein
MGFRKWGTKNMVTPSWESFQRPKDLNQNMQQSENKELLQEVPGEIQDQKKPEAEKPQWGNFSSPTTYQGEVDPTEEEDLLGYTLRNITSNASRLGEQYFGKSGNIQKMGKDILTNFPKLGGVLGWAISELMGQDKWEQLIQGDSSDKAKENLKKIKESTGIDFSMSSNANLPTSQNLKDISQTLSGGYTKPKTKGEEKFQEFTEDVGATVSARSLNNPVRNIALNNILVPAAANVTKNIVEDLGFGKDKANMAKLAVWMPLSLVANVNASRYAANLVNQGRNAFNPNLNADVPRYQNNLNGVARNMLQGDPRSALAQQQLAGINNDIANGQTTMRDLMTRYDAINAAKRDRGLFALIPGDRAAAIRYIDQVRDVVRAEIQALGQTNPQALEYWQNGIAAFATIHRSNKISNFVEELVKGPYSKLLTGPAAALFGVGSYSAIKAPLIAVPAAAIVPATYKTGQTIYRMWNNEHLANYYWNAISAAQAENIPAFINNYNKLNKELEKSDSVEKKTKPKKD